MGRTPRHIGPRSWEPEPLHLPAEPPRQRDRRSGEVGGETDEANEPDRPGSHVTVIDLG